MSDQIHSYAELKQQIHDDLRKQHPEWVQASGKCPECDEHEARLEELIEGLGRTESHTEAGHEVLPEDQTTPSSP